MPTTPHQHWYDQTTENGYPLSDVATRVDDQGKTFVAGLLLDAQIRYPSDLGHFPYISAITNGPGICTCIISVSTTVDAAGVPIAAATLIKKSDRRLVKLEPMAQGVGGWVVFGPIVTDSQLLSFRFSLPEQALLTAKAAQGYNALPIRHMKSLQAAVGLEGVVRLAGQTPFSVRKEVREIEGYDRQCVIFSLTADQGDEFSQADAPVLQQYLGPCDTRPESNTCPDPQPIETISQVTPNCNGQIIVEFRGCATATKYTDGHGFVINCSIPRVAVCPPPKIPSEDGTLPDEYNPIVITGTTTTTTGSTQPPDGTTPGFPLPFQECFRDGATDSFGTIQGQFNFVSGSDSHSNGYCFGETDDNLVLQAVGDNVVNIAAWVGADMKTVDRISRTHVMLTPGDVGNLINGSLIINFRLQSGSVRYFMFMLDYLRQSMVLYYYNGFTLQQIGFFPFEIHVNRWYALTVTTIDAFNAGVTLACTAQDLDFGGDIGELTVGPLKYFRPSDGINGIGSNNSKPLFSHFRHEELV